MRTRRSPRSNGAVLPLGWRAILVAFLVAAQSGCTREFYREWANQDVSEAVFEKSRDPRWRLDIFSIEPPALSRFAEPYDPDAPPAPPDDVAAEALSPVPQWPSNRLLVPVEGTGYRDLLEYWQRQDLAAKGVPPERTPSDPAVTGLPPNMGFGGQPWSPSSDPASRPGEPFRPFPGMANPFAPGTVIGPDTTSAPQPGTPQPSTSGSGTPPGGRTRGGQGASSSSAPRISPGSPNMITPSLSPGSPPSAPTRVSPGSPTPGGPSSPGGPGASAVGRPSDPTKPAKPFVRIVRLQDEPLPSAISTEKRPMSIPPPRIMNFGTNRPVSTPISLSNGEPKATRPLIPPPRSFSSRIAVEPGGARGVKDRSAAQVAFQEAMPPSSGAAATTGPAATAQPPAAAGQPAVGPQIPSAPGSRVPSIRISRQSRASRRSTAGSSIRRAS